MSLRAPYAMSVHHYSATPFPVLKCCMLLPGRAVPRDHAPVPFSDVVPGRLRHLPTRCPVLVYLIAAISLCTRYEISGTE
eukprot:377831-Rhodomonas_salina.5